MIRIYMRRVMAAAFGLALLAGCTNEVPTLSEAEELAPGGLPTTLEVDFSAGEILIDDRVQSGGTSVRNTGYLLVANSFDSELDAHVLARFRAFPDTIDLLESTDSQFTYLSSEVISIIPDSLRMSDALLDFQLWTLAQPWDSTVVTWEDAETSGNIVPWREPGGTRGRLVGMARWDRADTTAGRDSLVWDLPADVTTQLATGQVPGLMVTLMQEGSRAQIGSLVVRANLRPSTQTDTTITRIVGAASQEFIYAPEPEQPEEFYRVGGLTSDRSYLRLDLGNPLPACPPGTTVCTQFVTPSAVSLNRVELILDPVPVRRGFRILGPLQVIARRVFEPELEERAPLGQVIAVDSLSTLQGSGSSTEPFRMNLTTVTETLYRAGQTELALALLVEPSAARFGYGWFARNPRIRFVYTLPQTPELP